MNEHAHLPSGVTRGQIAAAITPRFQELIMLPTEKCNFRCDYCYEDFELGKMSATLQRAIELLLERRIPTLEGLRFSWFGGEPLLAKNVVVRISRFAKKLCDHHGVPFAGGMTTNGYLLTPQLASELIGLNQIFYQITLDGWGDQHDQTRHRADGKGTFHVIWKNLVGISAIPGDFQVQLRIHLTRQNLENQKILMNELGKTFGHDPRFYLDFQHIRDLGGAGSESVVDPLTDGEVSEIEGDLQAIFNAARVNLSDRESRQSSRSDEPRQVHGGASEGGGPPYICYASRPNSILIRSNGRIGKCTVAFSDARNDLGYLSDDGELVINSEKLQPWIRGLASLDRLELGCPMANMEPSSLESPKKRVIPIVAAA